MQVKYYKLCAVFFLSAALHCCVASAQDVAASSPDNLIPTTKVSLPEMENENAVDALAQQADKLYWQGQYSDALDIYKKLAGESLSNQTTHLHWLSSIADCFCRLNEYQQAQIIYQQLFESRKKTEGEHAVNLVTAFTDLAACDFYLRNYDSAENLCKKAIALLEKHHSEDILILAKSHLALAETLYHQTKYKEAASEYSTAITHYDQLYRFSHADVVEPLMVSLEGAGACFYSTRNYNNAKLNYERLANFQRDIFGDEDVRYGWSLVSLSDIDRKLGQDEISAALYEKSVWIFRKANKDRIMHEFEKKGELTPEIANRIAHYTYGYSDQSRAKKADNVLEKKENIQDPLQCVPNDRSLAKLGAWNLVTTADLDPPGWVWVDPSQPLHGVVICVHGLGLNAHSYNAFAKAVTPAGYTVIAFHVRGFGSYVSSKGGDKVNFQQCLDDLTTVIRIIKKDYDGLPIFLLGESMGGAIALQITANHPELVSGLICSVPAGSRYKTPSTDLEIAFHIVKGINKPFDIGTKIVSQATQEDSLRHEWQSDPFNRLSLTPKELIQFAAFMNHSKNAAAKITSTPVIVFQGVQDKLVKPKGTLEIYNSISSKDKDLVLVGSSEHLIFENRNCPKSVITGVIGWMDAHIQKQTPISIK